MNCGKLITQKISEEQNRVPDPKQKFYYIQHQEDDFQFQIKFKDAGKYGIILDYISINKINPVLDMELINKRLDQQANAIQKKITYLLEEFRLVEMDNQNKRAQLRSYPPHTQDNSKYYYEIVLDEGIKAHFQRYQFSIEEKRYGKITSQLTAEIFERLVNDLINILM
jgi:hypothetical protein